MIVLSYALMKEQRCMFYHYHAKHSLYLICTKRHSILVFLHFFSRYTIMLHVPHAKQSKSILRLWILFFVVLRNKTHRQTKETRNTNQQIYQSRFPRKKGCTFLYFAVHLGLFFIGPIGKTKRHTHRTNNQGLSSIETSTVPHNRTSPMAKWKWKPFFAVRFFLCRSSSCSKSFQPGVWTAPKKAFAERQRSAQRKLNIIRYKFGRRKIDVAAHGADSFDSLRVFPSREGGGVGWVGLMHEYSTDYLSASWGFWLRAGFDLMQIYSPFHFTFPALGCEISVSRIPCHLPLYLSTSTHTHT